MRRSFCAPVWTLITGALVLGSCGGTSSPRNATRATTGTIQAESTPPSKAARSHKAAPLESAKAQRRRSRRTQGGTHNHASPSFAVSRPWSGTAALHLSAIQGSRYTYLGSFAGTDTGPVSAVLTIQRQNMSGTFVARFGGGSVRGILAAVATFAQGQFHYSGSVTATEGTARYAHLIPTRLKLTGQGGANGITMQIAGTLRY
jgi:hypothetical protein